MNTQEVENTILTDYSGFKRMSFISGDTSVEDICVMEINTTQGLFSNYIKPDHYFPPTYCFQFVVKGQIDIIVNHRDYVVKANEAFLITPDFLAEKPKDINNYVQMHVLALSRKFMQELNPQFPLPLISYIYVHPVWKMTEHKTQRVLHYLDLLRDVLDDKDRTAAIHLVRSLFHYLAGNEDFAQQKYIAMSRSEDIAGRFMLLVDEHCEQQHSLDWYADKLNLTTRYVANTVKQTLGMTASACIEQALMQRARTMLYTTSMTIQEIADKLGFQNQSHFGTFFKRHAGVSPATFRKNNAI